MKKGVKRKGVLKVGCKGVVVDEVVVEFFEVLMQEESQLQFMEVVVEENGEEVKGYEEEEVKLEENQVDDVLFFELKEDVKEEDGDGDGDKKKFVGCGGGK